MVETAEHYKMRLETYIARKDPIAMQHEAARTLMTLIDGVPEANSCSGLPPGNDQ